MAGAMLAVMVKGSATDFKSNGFIRPLVFFAVICASLLYGFFDPAIDNAAHIGGLAGGFLCGLLLQPSAKPRSNVLKVIQFSAFAPVLILASAACILEAKADKRSTNFRVASNAIDALKSGRFADAYAAYNLLLKSELNPTYFIDRGRAQIGLHEYSHAIEDFDKAIAMSPKSADAYIFKAQCRHKLGEDIEAVEDLSTAINTIKLNPNPRALTDAFNDRAWFELVLGRFKPALTDADEALRIDPENSLALDTRGLIRYYLNQPERALTDFEHSIRVKPDEGAGYFHRALIYDKIEQRKNAAQDRQKAKELKYDPEPWELKLQSGD
jgi:tetratricopeptide (TPR) repeat protein